MFFLSLYDFQGISTWGIQIMCRSTPKEKGFKSNLTRTFGTFCSKNSREFNCTCTGRRLFIANVKSYPNFFVRIVVQVRRCEQDKINFPFCPWMRQKDAKSDPKRRQKIPSSTFFRPNEGAAADRIFRTCSDPVLLF